jgi:flagellar hook assembly protein FlgD
MDPDILNVVCGYPDESNPNVVNTSNVSADLGDVVPDKFALKQNYPNPFNPSTQISFDVPAGSDQVMINIYNILGQNVNTLVSGVMTPGTYTVDWNATDMMGNSVASGIYFYELRSKSFTARKKMLLIR